MAKNMDEEDMDDSHENGELIVTVVKCQDLFDCIKNIQDTLDLCHMMISIHTLKFARPVTQ